MATSAHEEGDAIRIAERQERAARLRVDGYSYREIATELEISVGQAFADVKAALAGRREAAAEAGDEVRQVELERLDVAVKGIMPAVKKGSPLAIDRLIKVSERRAKLTGIDKPTESKVSVDVTNLTPEQKAARVAELVAIAEGR